jgi:hypothetical protein
MMMGISAQTDTESIPESLCFTQSFGNSWRFNYCPGQNRSRKRFAPKLGKSFLTHKLSDSAKICVKSHPRRRREKNWASPGCLTVLAMLS